MKSLARAVDGFFGIDGLSDDAMKAGKLGLFGAASFLIADNVERNVPMVRDWRPAVRGATLIALGAGGAIAAAKWKQDDLAAALAVSMIGLGTYRIAQDFLGGRTMFLPAAGGAVAGLGAGQNYLDVPGLGGGMDISPASNIPGAMDGIPGLGDVAVGLKSPIPGVDGIGMGLGMQIETEAAPLGSWLG